MVRRSLQFAVLALVLSAASIGCGRGHSTTPASPTVPRGPCFIDLSTAGPIEGTTVSLDFGRVQIGFETRREVRIGNEGSTTFTVSAIERAQELPADIQFATAPFGVEPGAQPPLVITFRPTTAGDVSGSIRLVIQGGEPAEITIDLHGTGFRGKSPGLEVSPSVVDYGRVAVDTYQVRRATLVNLGADVPNTIGDNLSFVARGEDGTWVEKAPEIVGEDASLYFVYWPPEGYSPAGLAEGDSVELRIRFQPTTPRGGVSRRGRVWVSRCLGPRRRVRSWRRSGYTTCETRGRRRSLRWRCGIARTRPRKAQGGHLPPARRVGIAWSLVGVPALFCRGSVGTYFGAG